MHLYIYILINYASIYIYIYVYVNISEYMDRFHMLSHDILVHPRDIYLITIVGFRFIFMSTYSILLVGGLKPLNQSKQSLGSIIPNMVFKHENTGVSEHRGREKKSHLKGKTGKR